MTIVVVGVISLLVVAWLSAASAAVRSVSRIWLRHWVEQRLRGATVAELYLDRPQRLLAASGAGVAGAVAVLGATLGAVHHDEPGRLVLFVVSWGVLLLVVGQTIPRALGRHWATELAPVLLPPLRWLERIAGPLLAAARFMAGGRERHDLADGPESRDDIEDLLREGALEGIGARDEIAIITGVMDFGAKLVGDVMTRREDIFALKQATPPRDLAIRIAGSGYSRVPIYENDLDDMQGMVHVFDVLKAGGDRLPPIRPMATATDGQRCTELLVEMQRKRLHLAIVRDAQNRTVGLVTLEDLLEELVGDISDEHDEPEHAAHGAERA